MMPIARKRKGSGSTDGYNEDEPPSSSVSSAVRQRKKVCPVRYNPQEICQNLYDAIRNQKTPDGRLICEPFIRAPKRRTEPDYYVTVTTPMDLLKIQSKLKSEEYDAVDQMSTDVELMINNTKAFYPPNSPEYGLAIDLWDLFSRLKQQFISEALGGQATATPAGSNLPPPAEDSLTGGGTGDNATDVGADDATDVDDETSHSFLNTNDSTIIIEDATERVPILKLRVGSATSGVDGVGNADLIRAVESDQEASESRSILMTQHSRISSTSEQDEPQSEVSNASNQHNDISKYSFRDTIPSIMLRKAKITITDVAKMDLMHVTDSVKAEDHKQEVSELEGSHYEQLFAAVVTATSGNRVLCELFKILPSRTKLADYYQVIKEPMDLRTVAKKIQACDYGSLEEMAKDLMLVFENARTFNEPGSQIYKDANTLKKIMLAKKHELDQHKTSARSVLSQRIHSAPVGSQLSAVIAMLKPADDDETVTTTPSSHRKSAARSSSKSSLASKASVEPGGVESDTESSLDPHQDEECSELWALFNAVREYRTSIGQRISEPFVKLPSKRLYPDYYDEIEYPISMMKMKNKLKNDEYEDIDDLVSDFNLLFDNAKQYNVEDSRIYKDAVKLQQIMRTKRQELQKLKDASAALLSQTSPSARSSISLADSGDDSATKKKRQRSSMPGISGSAGVSGSVEETPLKKRLMLLFKTVLDYQFEGRKLVDIFRTLPSKKDYPDYYKVISEPIDMVSIESKIKADKYTSQQCLVEDLELMFKNARHYNEEHSQVYKDADTLERILNARVKALPAIDDQGHSKSTPRRAKDKPAAPVLSLTEKLQELFNTIRDHEDSRGRILSTPFMKLPLKSEYPDYYEIIKRPMDMQKVQQRMSSNQYHSVEEMVSDVALMFDNACRYNEPDSLIYKDALALQRVCLEKKAELCAADCANDVPDVQSLVQELMVHLFIATNNHTDDEGRCYSDSFLELPTRLQSEDGDTGNDKKDLKWAPSFEQVKRNLDKGCYKRMDRFQDDMFEVFDYARQVGAVDSQVYEDSIEMQKYFLVHRDELCRKGEVLVTPALSFTEVHLARLLETTRKQRLGKDRGAVEGDGDDKVTAPGSTAVAVDDSKQTSLDGENKAVEDDANESFDANKDKSKSNTDSYEYKGILYHIGDYVYVEPREKGLAPHIVCVERMHVAEDGEQWLHGCWFLRPNETYHLQTRKFLAKEVFKSDYYDSIPFSKALGKCYVMCVTEYFKLKPEGFSDTDVYVCESRYSGRGKTFKKIKAWKMPKNENLKLIERETILSPIRVASVFADKSAALTGTDGDRFADDGVTRILDKHREIVLLENCSGGEEGCTYYEQFLAPACWVKLGDCIYLKSDKDKTRPIVCIDKLWTTAKGESFFHGEYCITPAEVEHSPTRLFYTREVFRSSREVALPLRCIMGRCSVLSFKEYITSRVTEISPEDVYICESKYFEPEKLVKKLSKPFKRVGLSINVCDDEIYFFKKPIVATKEPSPLLAKAADMSVLNDDEESMDCGSVSLEASVNDTSSCQGEPTPDQTPIKKKRRTKDMNKQHTISGYIVFAGECRKQIQIEFPDYNFGDISRAVGTKWKALPKEKKEFYEEQAKIIAAEFKAKMIAEGRPLGETITLSQYMPTLSAGSDDSTSVSPLPIQTTAPSVPPQGYPSHFYSPPNDQGMPPPNMMTSQSQYAGSPYHTAMGGTHIQQQQQQPQHFLQYQQHPFQQQQQPYQQQQTQFMHPQQQQQPFQHIQPFQNQQPYQPQQLYLQQQPPFPQQQPYSNQQHQSYSGQGYISNYQPSASFLNGMPVTQHGSQPPPGFHPNIPHPSSAPSAPAPPVTAPTKPLTPMFIHVPARTQRLLHSDTYLRYIEGLQTGSRTVGGWDKTLSASMPENAPPNSQLPIHWLSNGPGHHESTIAALWALRDHMLKDAISISRTLEFDQL